MLYKLMLNGYDKYRFLLPNLGLTSTVNLEFELDDFSELETTLLHRLDILSCQQTSKYGTTSTLPTSVLNTPTIGDIVKAAVQQILTDNGGYYSLSVGPSPSDIQFTITLVTPSADYREYDRGIQRMDLNRLRGC